MGRARRRVNLARPPIPAQSKQMTKTVRIFRWIVFLLAAGYCLRTLAFSSFEHFAGPFRYLTIWALFMSFFAASRMMALVEGRSTRRWDGFVGATAVVNAMGRRDIYSPQFPAPWPTACVVIRDHRGLCGLVGTCADANE
jgi:hypothetical protein